MTQPLKTTEDIKQHAIRWVKLASEREVRVKSVNLINHMTVQQQQ